MTRTLQKRVAEARIEIAENLKSIRIRKGLSQTEAGELLGVTFQQWQKYEKASNRISAASLAAVAEELEVPLADFFAGLSIDGAPDYLARVAEADVELAEALHNLRPHQKQVINSLLSSWSVDAAVA